MAELAEWDSFCVIVGSSAGALIGLQFVVLTLLAESPALAIPEAGAAYGTPTIVHFAAVLLVSALLRVPWHAVWPALAAGGLVGLAGLIYVGLVALRLRRQSRYRPQLEDWVFHAALPLLGYALLVVAALAPVARAYEALFGVGGGLLLLLFSAIHNAWDSVAYHVFVTMRKSGGGTREDKESDR